MRHILHVVPTLDQSGAEKQLALLARHLPADRFRTSVVALTRGGHYAEVLEQEGVPVHVLGKRLQLDPIILWRLRGLLRELEPDLVQTWMFTGNSYGRVAARVAGKAPVIATERCVDRWKGQARLRVDRLLQRWTARIVANAEAVAEFYRTVGIDPQKLHVIPNAAELPSSPPFEKASLAAELGIDPTVPTIGFLGRLWPQKRVHDLIWAADILRISGWRLNLVIVGQGPRRPYLERFARNLDMTEFVHFLGHRADAVRLLGALDVLVLPSSFEGMPNVLLEAMAASKPVIATRIPGVVEVVEDERTGLLVPPKRPYELARALARLLSDAGLAKSLGEAGRRRIQDHFGVDTMVARYAALYDELSPAA